MASGHVVVTGHDSPHPVLCEDHTMTVQHCTKEPTYEMVFSSDKKFSSILGVTFVEKHRSRTDKLEKRSTWECEGENQF